MLNASEVHAGYAARNAARSAHTGAAPLDDKAETAAFIAGVTAWRAMSVAERSAAMLATRRAAHASHASVYPVGTGNRFGAI